jgi:hypothetical protein
MVSNANEASTRPSRSAVSFRDSVNCSVCFAARACNGRKTDERERANRQKSAGDGRARMDGRGCVKEKEGGVMESAKGCEDDHLSLQYYQEQPSLRPYYPVSISVICNHPAFLVGHCGRHVCCKDFGRAKAEVYGDQIGIGTCM